MAKSKTQILRRKRTNQASYFRRQIEKRIGDPADFLAGTGKKDILSEVFFPERTGVKYYTKRDIQKLKNINQRLIKEKVSVGEKSDVVKLKGIKRVVKLRLPKIKGVGRFYQELKAEGYFEGRSEEALEKVFGEGSDFDSESPLVTEYNRRRKIEKTRRTSIEFKIETQNIGEELTAFSKKARIIEKLKRESFKNIKKSKI